MQDLSPQALLEAEFCVKCGTKRTLSTLIAGLYMS
jgi:hypothetical protein